MHTITWHQILIGWNNNRLEGVDSNKSNRNVNEGSTPFLRFFDDKFYKYAKKSTLRFRHPTNENKSRIERIFVKFWIGQATCAISMRGCGCFFFLTNLNNFSCSFAFLAIGKKKTSKETKYFWKLYTENGTKICSIFILSSKHLHIWFIPFFSDVVCRITVWENGTTIHNLNRTTCT